MEYKRIRNDVYSFNLIMCTGSIEDAPKFVERELGNKIEPRANVTGCTWYVEGGDTYIVYVKSGLASARIAGILAHESFHVVLAVLTRVGMKLTEDSEEAYSYLLEWCVRQCHLFMEEGSSGVEI